MKKFQDWLQALNELDAAPQPKAPIAGGMDDNASQGGGTGLSDAQHTQDEESMDVSTIIRRRLEMLLDEIEKKRNMPRNQQLQIFNQILQTLQEKGLTAGQARGAMNQQTPPQQQPQQQSQQPQQQQQQQSQQPQPQPQQMPMQ